MSDGFYLCSTTVVQNRKTRYPLAVICLSERAQLQERDRGTAEDEIQHTYDTMQSYQSYLKSKLKARFVRHDSVIDTAVRGTADILVLRHKCLEWLRSGVVATSSICSVMSTSLLGVLVVSHRQVFPTARCRVTVILGVI